MSYLLKHSRTPTPQSEPLPGRESEMVRNNDIGYVFPVDKFVHLRRFLLLGAEGGTYYVKERELIIENVKSANECLDDDPDRVFQEILDASSFSAAKNDQSLFVLAMAVSHKDEKVRKKALDWSIMSKVIRQGSHLLQFVSYVDSMRNWSRMLRTGVGQWYLNQDAQRVAFQTLKYRNRYGWRHKDVLRKAHPNTNDPEYKAVFDWISKEKVDSDQSIMQQIASFEECKTAPVERIIDLVKHHNMSWEMLPTEALRHTSVWQGLLPNMPIIALTRNLGNMTSKGSLEPFGPHTDMVVERLENASDRDLSRLHPLNVLVTLLQYRSGRGAKGKLSWTPIPRIVDALDSLVDKSFSHSEPTGKRLYLGVDVSDSMNYGRTNVPSLTPMMGATTMAMVIARREPNYYIAGFSHELRALNFTAKDSLQHAIDYVKKIPYGATDCAMPMIDALKKKIPVDCFVILTDYETNVGRIHPCVALQNYRREMNIPAKLMTVSMTSEHFSIADPKDAGSMDMIGFDANMPNVLKQFLKL